MESIHLFEEFVSPVHPAAAYIGGKRKLASRLAVAIDRIPHDCYAECFVGMAGVYLKRTRRPRVEVINDRSEDVATFFRILQRHYIPFLDMLRFQVTSRAGFERLMRVDPSTQTDLERAARFLYLQRVAYGGKVTQRSFGVDPASSGSFDVTRVAPLLEAIHERLAGVTIERLDWAEFVTRYDRPATLFYLDPPYFGSERDYGADLFDRSQFGQMADLLGAIQGRFLLSINDTPEVREIFSDFAMVAASILYSISGQATPAAELVISNCGEDELARLLPDLEPVPN